MSEHARTVLWVVGEPGVGKTTFCRALLASYGTASAPRDSWTEFGPEAAAVGSWLGGKFDGGDTVPPSRIFPALQTYRERFVDRKLVLFDGAKFSNRNAVLAVADGSRVLGARLLCVHIVGPLSAASGRLQRVAAGAREQNPSWIRGRRTAAANFVSTCYSLGIETIQINRDAGESWPSV